MDDAASESFLLPDEIVEQFKRRLQARLLDRPEVTIRELGEILAHRLGMTHGPCRFEVELQDGVCLTIRRHDKLGRARLEEAVPWPN